MAVDVLNAVPAAGIVVSATASSVGGTVVCTGCSGIYVANTSATLYVAVRAGVGAQTAVITTDIIIPPMGSIVLPCNDLTTGVAAIGSAAGPTIVGFMPLRSGG